MRAMETTPATSLEMKEMDRSFPENTRSQSDWNADEQSLLAATLSATSAQRLAWLEEALELAYASDALKPGTPIEKRECEAASCGVLRISLIAGPLPNGVRWSWVHKVSASLQVSENRPLKNLFSPAHP